MRLVHHQRAHFEVSFRLLVDLDLVLDLFNALIRSVEEMGWKDDMFSTYINIEKLSAGGGFEIKDSIFGNVGVG